MDVIQGVLLFSFSSLRWNSSVSSLSDGDLMNMYCFERLAVTGSEDLGPLVVTKNIATRLVKQPRRTIITCSFLTSSDNDLFGVFEREREHVELAEEKQCKI